MVIVVTGGGALPLSIQEGMSSIDRVGFRKCRPFGDRERDRDRDRDRDRERDRDRDRELDLDTIELDRDLDLDLGLCVTATTTGSFVCFFCVLPSTFICCPNNAVPVNTLCAYNTLSGPSNSTKA